MSEIADSGIFWSNCIFIYRLMIEEREYINVWVYTLLIIRQDILTCCHE